MGQQYSYSTRWEKSIVAILHIYRARANYIIFCDSHETESEFREMVIGVVGPILNPKKIKGLMGKQYPYSTKREEILW